MSPARRRQMVDRDQPSLSLVRQCALLAVSPHPVILPQLRETRVENRGQQPPHPGRVTAVTHLGNTLPYS
ncbi:MAG: hypothetical protein OXR67_07885 [Chloroflexota bacterium]|nr:hypothetical protein [Chloroflexota bacterium]